MKWYSKRTFHSFISFMLRQSLYLLCDDSLVLFYPRIPDISYSTFQVPWRNFLEQRSVLVGSCRSEWWPIFLRTKKTIPWFMLWKAWHSNHCRHGDSFQLCTRTSPHPWWRHIACWKTSSWHMVLPAQLEVKVSWLRSGYKLKPNLTTVSDCANGCLATNAGGVSVCRNNFQGLRNELLCSCCSSTVVAAS